MSHLDQIEASFKTANLVVFYTNPKDEMEPSVVTLAFDKPDGAEGYDLLLDKYGNHDLTLIAFKRADKLNLSLVSAKTGDSVNLKNLWYREDELKEFLSFLPKDRPFVFVIGCKKSDAPRGVVFTATRKPFSPLIVSGYVIK